MAYANVTSIIPIINNFIPIDIDWAILNFNTQFPFGKIVVSTTTYF